MNDKMNDRFQGALKKSTIFDLLYHEINTTLRNDRFLDKIEKYLASPEVLKTMAPEQIDRLCSRRLSRIAQSHQFIIDFYKAASKSQELQELINQFTQAKMSEAQLIDGQVTTPAITSKKEEDMYRAKLIEKIDQLIEEDEEDV